MTSTINSKSLVQQFIIEVLEDLGHQEQDDHYPHDYKKTYTRYNNLRWNDREDLILISDPGHNFRVFWSINDKGQICILRRVYRRNIPDQHFKIPVADPRSEQKIKTIAASKVVGHINDP